MQSDHFPSMLELSTIDQLAVLMLAVVLLTLQAIVINRLAGLPYPIWNPVEPDA